MCGIVGYIGKQKDIRIGLEALRRLEYRGYDSAGMAVYNADAKTIHSLKAVGRVVNLEQRLKEVSFEGSPFLFYTRWATHGGVTEENCHPHSDCKNSVWVVHNGIIENYRELKEKLQQEGHAFHSETDTEVIPHLIERFFEGNLEEAVRKMLGLIRGSFALGIISKDDPEKLVVVRNSAPLLIGVGENEYLVASDPSAIVSQTKKVMYLEDGEMASLTPERCLIEDINHHAVRKAIHEIDWSVEDAQKGGYSHFMLKEIMEQPESITNALRGRVLPDTGEARFGGLSVVRERLRSIKRISITACGTAYYAGLVGRYMLEEYTGLPCEADVASEFRYRRPIVKDDTAFLFISQSGETADTLAALREVKKKGGLTLGIINVTGSSVARETDAGIYNHAGPEIGVASTKAFTSQLTILALLTLLLGRQREMSLADGQVVTRELQRIPDLVKQILEQREKIKEIAEKYKHAENFLFIGRKYNYPVALEGALKLKEISYIHAEGYGAGEMKHGPIALIDEQFPTIALCPQDSVYEKMVSNIQEIKARKGPVIAITNEGNGGMKEIADDVIFVPRTIEMLNPILMVIPLQLFAYFIGVARGYDVDKPRNLAKSVTVE
ncbi:MAG: glutamine--fructose-6-phosphate transaminase (isomerizing) [Candidatus Wildermuthbacteria bacterium]|nr:glutamine--fructose-6-phosphate transaminase (isomerizing) [Candidatus Wildermuthbacteria bacterium]